MPFDRTRVARVRAPAIVALVAMAACRSAQQAPPGVSLAPGAGIVGAGSGAAIAAAEAAERRFTPADVEFMSGMIPHHAQAIIMSNWCESHGARGDVQKLCQKIVIAQRDEIRMMRGWLRDRGQDVPDSMSTKHTMKMGDMMHEMLMPGMLTDEQMAALEKARGSAFDRLYLTGMIGHHQGAIDMVRELRSHAGAAEEPTVFRFSNDVDADQSAEIVRMKIMLESVPPL